MADSRGPDHGSQRGEPRAPESGCIRTGYVACPGVERQAQAQPDTCTDESRRAGKKERAPGHEGRDESGDGAHAEHAYCLQPAQAPDPREPPGAVGVRARGLRARASRRHRSGKERPGPDGERLDRTQATGSRDCRSQGDRGGSRGSIGQQARLPGVVRTVNTAGTVVLWATACVAVVFLGLDQALASTIEVDARSAHRAVWKVYGATRSGTAFAIGERHFLTCAHLIKSFADHGAKEAFLDRHGSSDSRRLHVNYGRVAMTLVQDIALFTTRETVDHSFALAGIGARDGETGLLAMGHPMGLALETLRQTDPITYHDELFLQVSVDRMTREGLSGSPVFRTDGKVVGMHCRGGANMSIAVKVEHLHRFLNGELPWTACSDHPSVPVCIEQAIAQARTHGQAGDRVAQYQLGLQKGSLDKDVTMLRRAAEGGFAPAQYALGIWLRKREQWTEAARWHKRSAEQGHPAAKVELSLLLYRAQGVPRDRERAVQLMLDAATSGHATAQYNVGMMYERGDGTARDVAKARQWLQWAADKGSKKAREQLTSLSVASTAGETDTGTMMRALKRSNVRAGPGTGHAKVDLLEVGEWVRVLERTGDWFRLEPSAGQPHRFVYGPLLSATGHSEVVQ